MKILFKQVTSILTEVCFYHPPGDSAYVTVVDAVDCFNSFQLSGNHASVKLASMESNPPLVSPIQRTLMGSRGDTSIPFVTNQTKTSQKSSPTSQDFLNKNKKPKPTTARQILSILKPLGISLEYDCYKNTAGFNVAPHFCSDHFCTEWVGLLNHFFDFSNDQLITFVKKIEPGHRGGLISLINERNWYSKNIPNVANQLRLQIPEVIKMLVEDYPDKVATSPQSKNLIAAYRLMTNGFLRAGEPEWPNRLFFLKRKPKG